jgi:hypothetical protein
MEVRYQVLLQGASTTWTRLHSRAAILLVLCPDLGAIGQARYRRQPNQNRPSFATLLAGYRYLEEL